MTDEAKLKKIINNPISSFTKDERIKLGRDLASKSIEEILQSLILVEMDSVLADKIAEELNRFDGIKNYDNDETRRMDEQKKDDEWFW